MEFDSKQTIGAALPASAGSALDYAIALQRAIEYHCKRMEIPESIARMCPHHARKLNARLQEIEAPNDQPSGAARKEQYHGN